jgi:hypothetical protein
VIIIDVCIDVCIDFFSGAFVVPTLVGEVASLFQRMQLAPSFFLHLSARSKKKMVKRGLCHH